MENQRHLNKILNRIQNKYGITIICAVDCGSRAYGLDSDSSDYDIRYIYIQNDQAIYEEDYLDEDARRMRLQGGLHECDEVEDRTYTDKWYIVGRRVLDVTHIDKSNRQNYQNQIVVDLHGWDVTFAVKKLHDINPSIVEWVFSPIVYLENPIYNFLKRARQLLIQQNRSSSLIRHYIGMGKKYFIEYIEDQDEVRVKKYMHCVRCCVMVSWLQINKQKQFQPMIQVDFNQVLDDLKPYLPKKVLKSVGRLVDKKRMSDKDTLGPRYGVLDRFIESILDLEIDSDSDEDEPKQKAYNRLLDSCFLKAFDNITFD